MKKHLLCALLFIPTACSVQVRHGIDQSKTFMWTRPAFLNIPVDQSVWHDFIYNQPSKTGLSVQVKSIYQKSLPKNFVSQYFLFGCQNDLLVAGDESNLADERDVRAEWLGINNSKFSGRMSINPEQRQLGFTITVLKDLGSMFDFSFFKDYWCSVELPIFAITNKLNLKQYDVNDRAIQAPHDIVDAFHQKNWLYCKMVKERTRVDASCILLKFGRAFLSQDHYQVVYYSLFNVPLGGGQNAKYLFDAFNGLNQHVGFGAGTNFQVLLNENASKYALCWFLNFEFLYLLRNKQMRTFDLRCKPWSRYMLYNRKDGPPNQNIPGVNILTYKCRVRPWSFMEFNTGWRLMTEHWEFEMGYDLWGHGDERVKILCDQVGGALCNTGIYGIAGTGSMASDNINSVIIGSGTTATSASKSTIANQAENDVDPVTGAPVFVPFIWSDIDIYSAEGQSAINHKFYGSLGYLRKGNKLDGFISVGGGLEFPQKNACLKYWILWFKVGCAH